MNSAEFAEYRPQLTRNVRTKIALCDVEGCICGNGCVVWSGALDSSGYASFKLRGVVLIAHRYLYEKLVGPIEMPCEACDGEGVRTEEWMENNEPMGDGWQGMATPPCPTCDGSSLDPDPTIDHLCKGHRNCMNVHHMEIVSRSENSRRANTRRHGGYRREDPSN